MRWLAPLALSIATLGCRPAGGAGAPADDVSSRGAGADQAEPIANAPMVFAEVESLPTEPEPAAPRHVAPGSFIELDWRAVDPSLSSLIDGPRARLEYGPGQPWIGALEPTVTAVVFVDYECPFCVKADEVLADLMATYPDDLRVVVRMFPLSFHANAEPAARAALAAHVQGQFAAMHALLFSTPGALNDGDIRDHVIALGLGLDQFQTDLRSVDTDQRLAADRDMGTAVGVQGVPQIYLNGREVMDVSAMKPLIEQELALADTLMAAGAPRRELWARMLAASEAPAP